MAVLGGERYLFNQMEIRHFPGWRVNYLSPADVITRPVEASLIRMTGSIARSLAVSVDVTEQKQAEKALRLAKEELSRYSKELERKVQLRTKEIGDILRYTPAVISRELHDELGQVLTALRMDAVWMLARLKAADSRAADRARDMCRLIDGTIQDVRSLAFRLRPGILDDLGLVDALELYTTDFERRTGITCLFDYGAVPEMDDTVATAAYRIAQEALTNVARHADAAKVEVRLQVVGRDLQLSVEDDGSGFLTSSLDASEALGVAGMRERASLVGGALDVWSRKGAGTRVRFLVPASILNMDKQMEVKQDD